MADAQPVIPGVEARPDGRATVVAWAPEPGRRVALRTLGGREVPLVRSGAWHRAEVDDLRPGTRYHLVLDGEALPDPASRSQPEGVFGPSEVLDPWFPWTDGAWRRPGLDHLVISEIHVGTFTPEGTLDGVIRHLDHLVAAGFTCVELMPVCPFPGRWGWGYDGVYPFAVHAPYGGPDALRRLVDACHARGLAVCLDVVYNHLGPLGNFWGRFGPISTPRYQGPWGDVLNLDGPDSDGVRRALIAAAERWVRTYHVDALRLDAVHGIVDTSPRPFFAELTAAIHALDPTVLVLAESDLGDPAVVRAPERGGWGCDAQWADDLHHALHALLTGERHRYYRDFGSVADVAAGLRDSYVYRGQYSPYRRRRHGADPTDVPLHRFVVALQNHDQIGNRPAGDRLTEQVPLEGLRAALALVILGGHVPLLFQGEEWGAREPFPYFTDHPDPDLAEAVRRGRRAEFGDHAGEVLDPQDEGTFRAAVLDWGALAEPEHAEHLAWVRALIALRRSLAPLDRDRLTVTHDEAARVVAMVRADELLVVAHLGPDAVEVSLDVPEGWRLVRGSAGLPEASVARWALPGWALGVYAPPAR